MGRSHCTSKSFVHAYALAAAVPHCAIIYDYVIWIMIWLVIPEPAKHVQIISVRAKNTCRNKTMAACYFQKIWLDLPAPGKLLGGIRCSPVTKATCLHQMQVMPVKEPTVMFDALWLTILGPLRVARRK